jgi:hypothetical protein
MGGAPGREARLPILRILRDVIVFDGSDFHDSRRVAVLPSITQGGDEAAIFLLGIEVLRNWIGVGR